MLLDRARPGELGPLLASLLPDGFGSSGQVEQRQLDRVRPTFTRVLGTPRVSNSMDRSWLRKPASSQARQVARAQSMPIPGFFREPYPDLSTCWPMCRRLSSVRMAVGDPEQPHAGNWHQGSGIHRVAAWSPCDPRWVRGPTAAGPRAGTRSMGLRWGKGAEGAQSQYSMATVHRSAHGVAAVFVDAVSVAVPYQSADWP